MKRFVLCALCAVMLMPMGAGAQGDMVSLSQLKEQVPAVWEGNYEGKDGKTVTFEAPVLMPEADVFPVFKVERQMPDEETLAAYSDKLMRSNLYETAIGSFEFLEEWTHPEANRVYHNVWAANTEIDLYATYADGQSRSIGEVMDKFTAIVKDLYGDETDVILDVAKTRPAVEMRAKMGGGFAPVPDAVGMGGYELTCITTLRGVPMLGGPKFRQGYSGRAENILNYWFDCDVPLYYSDDFCWVQASGWRTTQEVYSDVPLCTFDKVQETVEKLIAKGKVHGVMAVYLGYVTWLDPEVEYIEKTNSKNWNDALAKPCIVTPMWVVECQYASDSGKSLDDYPEFQGTEVFDYRKHMWGHSMLMIDPQTAEAYNPWDTLRNRAYAPKVMTWDDVK